MRHSTRCVLALTTLAAPLHAQATAVVSVNSTGIQGDNGLTNPRASSDGRFLVFAAASKVYEPLNPSNVLMTILRDRLLGTTETASLGLSGAPVDGDCTWADVSDDGRYVVYSSAAQNIVPGDLNFTLDVFLRDRVADTTSLMSVDLGGGLADGPSQRPTISDDGRWVAFTSSATDLVAGDANGYDDVFVRDLQAATTTRASVGAGGVEANGQNRDAEISGLGGHVVFTSYASNLALDTNGLWDVFVRDLALGSNSLASVDSFGGQVDIDPGGFGPTPPSISADGRFVGFDTLDSLEPADTNNALLDIYLRDLLLGQTHLVSRSTGGGVGNGNSVSPCVSPDGRFVAFYSSASNLVIGDSGFLADVFLRDTFAGTTTRMSIASNRAPGNDISFGPVVVTSGADQVFFRSFATNLGQGLTIVDQLFMREQTGTCGVTESYCTPKVNSLGCTPRIAATGTSSVGSFDDFFVSAYRVLANKSGILFWGCASQSSPFGGGTLCVSPPIVRTSVQNSGGPTGSNCDGTYGFHLSRNYMAANLIQVGDTIFAQWWMRDPGFAPPSNVGLSDAISFTRCN